MYGCIDCPCTTCAKNYECRTMDEFALDCALSKEFFERLKSRREIIWD